MTEILFYLIIKIDEKRIVGYGRCDKKDWNDYLSRNNEDETYIFEKETDNPFESLEWIRTDTFRKDIHYV